MGVFIWFGVGFGLPLFLLYLLSGDLMRWVTQFFANTRVSSTQQTGFY
jgi:hypothetical protein